MTGAVRALVPFAFGSLRLHRLEAACIPSNAASIRLLEKAGFVREGYAREYLCINGLWQDHLLFGRLAGDWTLEQSDVPLGRPGLPAIMRRGVADDGRVMTVSISMRAAFVALHAVRLPRMAGLVRRARSRSRRASPTR